MDHCPHCGGYLKDYKPGTCLFCGSEFKPTRKWQKFCKPLCTTRYHYAARLKKEREGVQVDGQE